MDHSRYFLLFLTLPTWGKQPAPPPPTPAVLVWSNKATLTQLTYPSCCHCLTAKLLVDAGHQPVCSGLRLPAQQQPTQASEEAPTSATGETPQPEGEHRGHGAHKNPQEALWVQMRTVRDEFLKSHLLEMYQLQCDEEPLKGKPQITFPLPGEVRGTTSEIHHCWGFCFCLRMGRGQRSTHSFNSFAFVPCTISSLQPSSQFSPHMTRLQLPAKDWALSALGIPVPPQCPVPEPSWGRHELKRLPWARTTPTLKGWEAGDGAASRWLDHDLGEEQEKKAWLPGRTQK